MDEFWWHVRTIWYRIRTGQFCFGWVLDSQRFIGPSYMWYDGPNYAFGLWYFAFYLDDYKDRYDYEVRLALYNFLSTVLKS